MNQIKAQLTPQFLQGVMAETKQTWRKCQRKNYDVYATIMPAGVMFANRLEQPEVYKQLINCYGTPVITPDKKPSSIDPKSLYTVQEGQVVLCGTRGELWTVKAEKFLKSYTTQYTDNKTLEKKLKQGWVVASRAGEDKPQAVGICIPAKYLVQVQLSWATLYMNDPRSGGHGVGDILVCACDAQGNPMLNSSDNFSPTNNEVFSCTYDLGVGGWTKAGYVKLAQDLSTQVDLDWVKKNIPVPNYKTDLLQLSGYFLNNPSRDKFMQALLDKDISEEVKDKIFANENYRLNYLWYIAVNSGKYKGNLIMSYLLDVKGWVSVYQRVELDELKSWLTKILPESELQTVNTYWNNIETDGMGEENWQMSRYISFVGDSEYAAGIIALLYKMHTSQAIQDIDRVLQSYIKQYKSDIAEYGYTNLINVLVKKGINPADVGIKDTRVFEQLIKDHSNTPELEILINPYIEANCDDSVYERKLKTAMFKVMDSSHVNYVSAFRAVNICMESLPVSTTKLILKYFMYCHKEIPSGMGFWAYVEDALDNNNIKDTKALLRAAQISPDVLNQLTTELNQRHQLNTSLNQFIHDLQSQYSWYKAQNIKHL